MRKKQIKEGPATTSLFTYHLEKNSPFSSLTHPNQLLLQRIHPPSIPFITNNHFQSPFLP